MMRTQQSGEAAAALSYIRSLYAAEDELLQRIRKDTPAEIAQMQIAADEGRLLQLIIALRGVKSIVEIGTLFGYSTIWMARALPDDGHIHTINKDKEQTVKAQQYFAQSDVAQRITQYCGEARDVLPQLTQFAPFDMVFIDADKLSYPHYLDWAEANLRRGGLVVADNTFLFGTVWQQSPPQDRKPTSATAWQAMREFNARLADRRRYNSTIIPTVEGLSIAIKCF